MRKNKTLLYRFIDKHNISVIILHMNSKQFKKWLEQQGATFQEGKGSHLKVFLNGKQSILPMHNSDLKTGTVEGIKKQLGLKGK
ncbi:type II toxin-antitoxin system HicA family toxin [Methylomonas rapida]|uniref:Type II toxin-antitoxin system HicA family toxin n=1 Tax=Methylomonas rapida TaxID=2963939 RepID=A0ABY7GQX0_9GAMM|nr:type II toxin-antitoxin system HicA family toxin [Methylomonas rapida]WAR46906.1 type II toxin-antitoxin system HicA family toxin [Methylomonas rapida]